ncbi:MAG TPA: lanthionine synthetase LanC family protein, partial [Caulobacteraceae bacterium]|nr:lanthionine synthetase LanC family protein [Caulobacteraceae bacterium]
QRVAAAPHVEDIVAGFSSVYDFLLAHRDALAAADGPLAGFRSGVARRVLRPTTTYVRLLDRSWHPRFAADLGALEADVRTQLAAPQPGLRPSRAERAIERRALIGGDVPYFSVRVAAGGGRACRRRLAGFSADDKARQVWVARMALTSFETPLAKPPIRPAPAADADAIEAAARGIGERLSGLAIRRGGRASWLYPFLDGGVRLTPVGAGFDLYDGLAGIALVLGGLAARLGEPRFARLAEATLAEALDLWRGMKRETIAIGAYDGAAGLAWTLAVLARQSGRRDWLRQAGRIVRVHAGSAAADPLRDLISGRAGFLAAGLAVAEITSDEGLVRALRPCALSLALDELPAEGDAGLAHGRAGIGFALAQFARHDADAGAFERAVALIEDDLAIAVAARAGEGAPEGEADGRTMLAWCRGGVGAALALLRLGRPAVAETEALVQAVAADGGAALCPCHGALGVLEFLEAAKGAGFAGAASALDRLRAEILARVIGGELCADPCHRIEAPGLMMGLAGTGWSLLRVLDPARFPSVLTLGAA